MAGSDRERLNGMFKNRMSDLKNSEESSEESGEAEIKNGSIVPAFNKGILAGVVVEPFTRVPKPIRNLAKEKPNHPHPRMLMVRLEKERKFTSD